MIAGMMLPPKSIDEVRGDDGHRHHARHKGRKVEKQVLHESEPIDDPSHNISR